MSAVGGGAGRGPDETVEAYIRHLVHGEEAPSLAGVEPGARAELEETFTLLDAIAGIDPDLVPEAGADPVAQSLGFEPSRGPGAVHLAQADEVRLRIAEEIGRMHRGALVSPDEEAALVPGARSDLLVRVAGVRIRVVVVGAGELAQLEELLAEADRLFYRFPETAAVAIVAADDQLSCQLVEAQDCRPAVEVPAGVRVGPHPRRPELPLRVALESYLDEIEPLWDEPEVIGDAGGEAFDVEAVAAGIATAVVRRLADEASRARIAAKRGALTALGDREIAALTRLVVDVSHGRVAAPGVGERLAVLMGDAA